MNYLLKNKFALIAVGATIIILILILALFPRRSTSRPTPPPTGTSQLRSELVDLSAERKLQAAIYTDSIADQLPLYLENFPTSVGIDTAIHLYRLDDDPDETVRLEIYGLSYLNKDELDEQKNPNVTAFKEAYAKALSLLRSSGIDPLQLIFIYGDKEYVRTAATEWVEKLGLLK